MKKKDKRIFIENDGNCGICPACCLNLDCGKCTHCLDKPKFGGQHKIRQRCKLRICNDKRPKSNRIRCDCKPCSKNDCGNCTPCLSKPKFGGAKSLKKKCEDKICLKPKIKTFELHKKGPSCGNCNKRFRNQNELARHTCKTKHTCKQCGKTFAFFSKLEKHVSTSHKTLTEEEVLKRKKCNICERTFSNNQTLKRHHEQMHLGIRRKFE